MRQTRSSIAIVRSSHYDEIVAEMEEDARNAFREAGCKNIATVTVPGAFEIPLACKRMIEGGNIRGVIALGVIVQGETHHAAEIARACTDGMMQVQLQTGIPIAHGVLFVDDLRQAKKRARGEWSRGREAALALLKMIAT